MQGTIIISTEELDALLRKIISEYLQPTTAVSCRDNLSMDEAIALFNEQGLAITKGSLYKITSKKQIPYKKFGKQLVFSRKELLSWMQGKVHNLSNPEEAAVVLRRSINRKKRS